MLCDTVVLCRIKCSVSGLVLLYVLLCSTYFGREKEISGFTWFDGHGVEFDQNHWMLVLHTPGSEIRDVPPPVDEVTECPQICQNTCVNAADTESAKITAAADCDPASH